jgi:hypothetical protein
VHGRLQVLEQQGPTLRVQVLAAGGHDLVDVGLGLGLGVDAPDTQPIEGAVERPRDVGGRVGGGEVNAVPALHQPHGDRCSDRGLAHAPLPMTMISP